jgi:hypothetical protein
MKSNDLPIYQMFYDLCNNVSTSSWASKMNSIIDHLGFSNIRLSFDPRVNYYLLIKSRM